MECVTCVCVLIGAGLEVLGAVCVRLGPGSGRVVGVKSVFVVSLDSLC